MRQSFSILLLVLGVIWRCDANATPLFDDEEILDIELIGPLHSLLDTRKNPVEMPFVLRTQGGEHQVKVRLRGQSRLRVCDFPPLRLRFEPDAPSPGVFDGQAKLRLVTHCRNSEKGDKYALKEYAAYHLFSLFSDISYRVRPMRVTYTDTEGKLTDKARQRYAFAIEPMTQLAARSGGTPLKTEAVSVSRLSLDQASLVYVFQYMIGNTDWSFVMADGDDACCHNGDLLELDRSIYYVPYDFDLAGIVNAGYAKPDPSLRLKNVRQRRYRGYCTDMSKVRAALRAIKSRQSDVMQTVRSIPGLTEEDKDTVMTYLGKFFDKAEDEDKLIRVFEKRCIG